MPSLKRPRDIATSPLPDLLVSDNRTTSSTLHKIQFAGPLLPWTGFTTAVKNAYNTQQWSNRVIQIGIQSRNLTTERVFVGDEAGVCARFQQAAGQVLGAVFEAQSINIALGDFKCTGLSYSKTPDVVMLSLPDLQNGNVQQLRVVGEVKVPWLIEHRLDLCAANSTWLREVLAQPISYMLDLGCVYGFITNYCQTMFLRQIQVGSTWRIEHSPVIESSVRYVPSDPANQVIGPMLTFNQCLLYLATIAETQGPITNPTPRSQWIRRRRS
ncbi:hypothetical protein N7537_009110 [Penicillium hordei]|uniref:Uncharacterized protein n=1 Tax=Penicillium hordei TaxID=40994 RepID=A0AAD6DSG7_9EURO|nr:uncharacterized protein N7537_009110 [Penicillium hordei]KAJ5592206.1 hypothetical protein N7537_009110 [Penicillium hordei]